MPQPEKIFNAKQFFIILTEYLCLDGHWFFKWNCYLFRWVQKLFSNRFLCIIWEDSFRYSWSIINFIKCPYFAVREACELAFKVKLGFFNIGSHSYMIVILRILEKQPGMVTYIPLSIFLVGPVPFLMIFRNNSALRMLKLFCIIFICILKWNNLWKKLMIIEKIGSHERNSVSNSIIIFKLWLK